MSVGDFITGAAIGAAAGAACGAAGAALLLKAGYANYVVVEATRMGAVGSGLLGAAGFFKGKEGEVDYAALIYGQVVGGLIGYAVFHACAATTVMTLGKTAAALAVGSLAIPTALLLFALFVVGCMLLKSCCCPGDTSDQPSSTRLGGGYTRN